MKKDPKQFKAMMEVTSVGLAMGISMLLGLWVGRSLDKFFDTSPWLTVIFLFFGIAGGFRNMYVSMKKHMSVSYYSDEEDEGSLSDESSKKDLENNNKNDD